MLAKYKAGYTNDFLSAAFGKNISLQFFGNIVLYVVLMMQLYIEKALTDFCYLHCSENLLKWKLKLSVSWSVGPETPFPLL